jgi:putative ABC transport system ATP-binding protein
MPNKAANEIIVCKDLRKIYSMGEVEVHALRGLDLNVDKGEFVGILGPSGCGKTTLLQVLGGLATPTSGTVMVDNLDMTQQLRDGSRTQFRQDKIGFVFQRFNLLTFLTAADNLRLAFKIRGEKVSKFENRVKEMMDMVGLSHRMDARPMQMSQGEQQRVAIARALITNPSIVLADEPTGNLDSDNSERILSLMQKLNKELGQTILMITHDRSSIDFTSRAVQMLDGRVIDHNVK